MSYNNQLPVVKQYFTNIAAITDVSKYENAGILSMD